VRGLRDEVERLLARPEGSSRPKGPDLGARLAVARDRLATLEPASLSPARRARVEQALDALLASLD
jgi:hypothetical protein